MNIDVESSEGRSNN